MISCRTNTRRIRPGVTAGRWEVALRPGFGDDRGMKGPQETARVVQVDDPSTGRRLTAWIHEAGDDVVVVIGGGDRPHVGCVVLAVAARVRDDGSGFSVSSSVLTIPPHKEEPIARGVATRIAETLGRVTVVTAGVHDDGIDSEGIATYLHLGKKLTEKLVEHLAENSG